MNYRTRLTLIAAALLLPVLAQAQVYKWVDANGKVQYGDQPPPDAKTSNVKVPSNNAPQTATPGAGGKTIVVDQTKPPEKKEAPVTPAEALKNCNAMTADIQSTNEAGYVTAKDAKGKEYDLSASQMKSEMERMRKQQAYWCGKAGK